MSNPALINCPACRAQVSNQAPACPNCGQPISGGAHTPPASRQPSTPPPPRTPFQQYTEPPERSRFGRRLGIGCLALFGLCAVLTVFFIPQSDNRKKPAPEQPPAVSYPKERTQRGEKLFNAAAAKYRMMVEFGWQAQNISLPVPESDWNALSKEDRVNLSLYAESLVPAVRASPRKYVDKWKQRVETLELPYQEFVDAATRLCDECWEVEVGKPVKDINGIWDVEGKVLVSGKTAAEFRRAAEPGAAGQSTQTNSKLSAASNDAGGGKQASSQESELDEDIAGMVTKRYLSDNLNDPDSLQDFQVVGVSKVAKMPGAYKVMVFYRAKNGFGALVGQRQSFLLTRGNGHWTGWTATPVKE